MWLLSPKTLPAYLALSTLLLLVAAPAGALHEPSDGITASIAFDDSIGDLVLVADEDGAYTAQIVIYQNTPNGWTPISMRATLRVFEDTGPLQVTDRVSIPFTSSATGAVAVTFPGDAFTGGSLDVFVTFSALGGDPVPTSHHHLAKNAAIALGEHAIADGFDHHSTRVLAI